MPELKLPPCVRAAVIAIAADTDTREVWLIGSQANGTATPESDWDLLVMSAREPVVTEKRFEGIDVLHLGPSGKLLLEGMSSSHELQFTDFRWVITSPTTAAYRGMRFIPVEPGVGRDIADPRVIYQPALGALLWSREARSP